MSADLETILAHAARGRPIADPPALSADDAATLGRHSLGPLAHAIGVPGFERQHIASSLFYEQQQASAREAIAAIADAGVPVLLIKGMALAGRLYADPAERPMSDIDLLVPSDAHADAAAALRRCGYWIAGEAGERGRFHHAASFKRRGASIDLHRSVVQPLRAGSRSGAFFRRATLAPAPLAPALVPDAVDEALIVLAHIARHELAVRAINIVDAVRCLDRLDAAGRDELRARATALELARPIRLARERAESLDANGAAAILATGPLARGTQIWRKLSMANGVVDAARLAANATLERLGL